MSDVSPAAAITSTSLFNKAELQAMIDTAHAHGVKVAAHANTSEAIEQLLDLGVDTIEHGSDLFEDGKGTTLIQKWAKMGGKTVWVPTLAVAYTLMQQGLHYPEAWDATKKSFEKVLQFGDAEGAGPGRNGIRIACGGDTGAFPHGENGLELILMRRLGADWATVLSWCTLGGWKCVRGMEWEGKKEEEKIRAAEEGVLDLKVRGKSNLERGVPFGAVRKGWAGDLVGIEGCLDGDASDFERAIKEGVKFVMKGGVIYKRDGMEVVR